MIAIWRYTAIEWGIERADRYEAQFIEAAGLLCTHAEIGSPRYFKGKIYRKWSVGRHVVIYRHSATAIMIVSVIHSAADTDKVSR